MRNALEPSSWHAAALNIEATATSEDDVVTITFERLRPSARLLIALATALVGVIGASPAVAAGWHVEATPAPAGVSGPELMSVSCVSAMSCLAVGYSTAGSQTFGDSWNGSVWSTATFGEGSEGPVAPAVSCATGSFCMAVGGNGVPVAYRWDGTVLTRTPAPWPGSSRLTSVSCVSETFCMLVGSNGSGSQPLAANWNGTSWRIEHPPSQGDGASLGVVSCPAANACFAAGYYDIRTSEVTADEYLLIERWSGNGWVNQHVAEYDGLFGNLADDGSSISCATRSSCVLVGADDPQGNGAPEAFAEAWDGRQWKPALAGLPPQYPRNGRTPKLFAYLTGVSCWSATRCLSVGSTYPAVPPYGPTTASAMLWNGRRWQRDPGAVPPGGHLTLLGASCVHGGICTIVGARGTSAFAEQNASSTPSGVA